LKKASTIFDFISMMLLVTTGLYLLYVFAVSLSLIVKVVLSLIVIFYFFKRLIMMVERTKIPYKQENFLE